MLKRFLAAFVVVGIFVGGLFAVEGVIVKREKGDLTVKVGTEDKVFKLKKGVKIIDADGTELKGKEGRGKLKAGVKVDIKEEDGDAKEIKIK